MRILSRPIIFLLLIIMISVSCKNNHYKVNTSSIDVKVDIKRLEMDLFTLNPDEISENVPLLKKKYNDFLQLFSYVINSGDIHETSFGDMLVRFCTDKQNNDVYNRTMELYPDVNKIEIGLEDAFRHYLYYFPGRGIPEIFTCITGFNTSIILGDSVLAIGLDRYLGADCPYYPQLEIYNYMAVRMTPDNIISDCIYGWGSSEWDLSQLNYAADNVLTEILHLGKLKYFERCMLPETSQEIIFGFSSEQLKFCNNNEDQMWQYLIEHNLLFSSDQLVIRKLTGEAPFTSYFTNESPGKAAVWIGFRIVESYMMKNPSIKLNDLMNHTDVQDILSKAKYSPQ